MDQKEKPALRANPRGQAVLRGVIAGYLVYLGGSLVYDLIRGSSTLAPWLVWTVGPLFVICGLGFGLYTWRRWKADEEAAAKPKEPAAEEPAPEDPWPTE